MVDRVYDGVEVGHFAVEKRAVCAAKSRRKNLDEWRATADYMADLDQSSRVVKGYRLTLRMRLC